MMAAERTFLVEKQLAREPWGDVPGLYLNSPPYWVECGMIEARTIRDAAVKACFENGTSIIRVTPMDEGSEQEHGGAAS